MNKALFLDRDGVINVDKVHVSKISDFEFNPGIFDLAKKYQNEGFLLIVITNQAGIAKALYTEKEYYLLTEWMVDQFAAKGIVITKVYHCPHHPEYTGECECRKPNPGMILKAIREFNIDASKSVLIGDKESDLEAGRGAGIGSLILY